MEASSDTLLRLQSIFRDVLDISDLNLQPSTSPADLDGWDSVAMVQIVLAAEAEFDVRLAMADVASIKNAGDLVRVIDAKR